MTGRHCVLLGYVPVPVVHQWGGDRLCQHRAPTEQPADPMSGHVTGTRNYRGGHQHRGPSQSCSQYYLMAVWLWILFFMS